MKKDQDLEKLTELDLNAKHLKEPVKIVEDDRTGDRFLIYQADDGIRAEFRFQDETLWMSQAQIADFFDKDQSSISRHIANIVSEDELEETSR